MAASNRLPVAGCRLPDKAGRDPRDRGFALLLVLWSMVLLALLGAQVTGAGRSETKLAAALREGAQLQAAADAAVHETIWHMIDGGGDYWPPGAMVRTLNEAAGRVTVTVTDERGKLDVNQAPPALMQALFAVLGADRTTAQTLANAIAEWRTQQQGADDVPISATYRMQGRAWGPAGQEFQRLDELQLVLGMTPELYSASLPYFTMALEQGPWTQFEDAPVLAAVARAKRDSGLNVEVADPRGPVVLRMTAHVEGRGGAAFTRRVLFRLDGTLSGPAWKYRILSWEDGS